MQKKVQDHLHDIKAPCDQTSAYISILIPHFKPFWTVSSSSSQHSILKTCPFIHTVLCSCKALLFFFQWPTPPLLSKFRFGIRKLFWPLARECLFSGFLWQSIHIIIYLLIDLFIQWNISECLLYLRNCITRDRGEVPSFIEWAV